MVTEQELYILQRVIRIDLRQLMQEHQGQMKSKQDPLPVSPVPIIHDATTISLHANSTPKTNDYRQLHTILMSIQHCTITFI